jgi:hypothetical protein
MGNQMKRAEGQRDDHDQTGQMPDDGFEDGPLPARQVEAVFARISGREDGHRFKLAG